MIIEPLVIGEVASQKGSNGNQEAEIIVDRRDGSNLVYKYSPKKEDGTADEGNPRQPIRKGFTKTPKAYSPGFVQKNVVPQKEKRDDKEGDMENGCNDRHGGMGAPNGFFPKGDEPI